MPLFWLSLAFLAGILLADALSPLAAFPPSGWLGLGLVALLLGLLPRFARRLFPRPSAALPFTLARPPLPLWVLLVALCLGAARFQLARPAVDPAFIAYYNDLGYPLVLEGVVVEPPDGRDAYTNLRLQVQRLRPAHELTFTSVDGLLLARLSGQGDWRYGDRLRLEGDLRTPPENEEFSYRDYLARQGVYSYIAVSRPEQDARVVAHGEGSPLLGALYAMKARSLALVYRLWPDPEASLLAGILLGVESGIPQGVQDAFRDTGTSHIIAISGFNISIISALFALLFGRLLGPRRGALAAVIGIGIYTLLVGASPPVVRAALMGGLGLFAAQVGRRQVGLNALAVIALLMALWNPNVLWDVGFQLSFAATLGLVLYAEPLAQVFAGWASRWLSSETVERISGPLGEYFLFTFAAQLLTLPLIAYHFQRLSLSSLLVNPLILPAQPPVMLLGGLALLLGLVYQPLGSLAAPLVWPFVLFSVRVVELFAALPGFVVTLGELSLPVVLLFYATLFAATAWYTPVMEWLRPRLSGPLNRLQPLILTGMLALTVLVWQAAYRLPDGRLHLTVLDVSSAGRSGDALLIQSPTGGRVLVDGGPSASRLSDALGRRLPLAQRELDYLVVASPSDDRLAALPGNLERYPPGAVLWAGPTHGEPQARRLQEMLNRLEIPQTSAQSGQALDLGGGARLQVLAVNSRGAVLLLEYGSFRLLLPLGLDFETLAALQSDPALPGLSALLLAENGYAPLNPPALLAHLQPRLVLLSVAPGDLDGLPDAETLQAVEGYTLLRTDRDGWIEITSDGEKLWIEVEK